MLARARAGSEARGSRRRARALGVLVAVSLGAFSSRGARAQDPARDLAAIEQSAEELFARQLSATSLRSPTHVEERLTDGELFFRLHDYQRSAIILSDIVDNYPEHRAAPDALFLLGESLLAAGDDFGARTRFRVILDRGAEPRFRPYVQRALGRLVEIAIRTHDFTGVEGYFQRLAQLGDNDAEGTTTYYRAKYLYSRAVPFQDQAASEVTPETTLDLTVLEQARALFASVPAASPLNAQARYFVGVVHTLRREFPQAIEAFRSVLEGQATTQAQRQVAELAWLALGRIYYETDQLQEAVDAYQSVPRTSTVFARALFEIAWVHIRMGDAVRAERALEVLTVAAPDSPLIPDGKLLRGQLLLRAGRFDAALRVFREVREEYGPIRRELDAIAEAHPDVRAYFRQLVRENMEAFDANHFLPERAREWASLEGEFERSLSVLSDLAQTRQLVRETEQLAERLGGALASRDVVHIFVDLRNARRETDSLSNRLIRVRAALLAGESRGGGSPELEQVRARRRELEQQLENAPRSPDAFADRAAARTRETAALGRTLRELEVQLIGLEARATATERFLAATAEQRQGQDVSGVLQELANHRASIETYRTQITELRHELESIRLGGDDETIREQQLRAQYIELVAEERRLSGGGANDRTFERIASLETRLAERDAQILGFANERVATMRQTLAEEQVRIEGYRRELTALETESEDVVGGVTYATFQSVRRRFYNLILQADVGRIDVAWQRREQHRLRIEQLTRERAEELQRLDDEFREITEGDQ